MIDKCYLKVLNRVPSLKSFIHKNDTQITDILKFLRLKFNHGFVAKAL